MTDELKKTKFSIKDAFSRVAFWQLMAFVFLFAFVWAVELLDLTALMFNTEPQPFNFYRASLLSAGIITAGIITIGHTYEKQRTTVSNILEACLYCHKIKTDKGGWEHVEEYFVRHFPVAMDRSVCPDCGQMLNDLDKHVEEKRAD